MIYQDLLRAQKKLILQNELHLLYLVAPVHVSYSVNWELLLKIYHRLVPVELQACENIGIQENFIVLGTVNAHKTTFRSEYRRRTTGPAKNI